MSTSNDNGRVFEYLLVESLLNEVCDHCFLNDDTIRHNLRDESKVKSIDTGLLVHFEKSLPKITKWILQNIKFKIIEIQRLGDDSGRRGDVTDIRLFGDGDCLNISCKNNNFSIKHQRPGPTFSHLGLGRKDPLSIRFINEYKLINEKFFNKHSRLIPGLCNYNEISEECKKKDLYEPICNLVSNILNSMSERSQVYQDFLIGKIDYKQISLMRDRILIKSFDTIPKTTTMVSSITDQGYVEVDFLNSIILRMRLHTASSRISLGGSLKFDTKIHEMDLNEDTLLL